MGNRYSHHDDVFQRYPFRILGLGVAIGQAVTYSLDENVVMGCNIMAIGYLICHALHRGLRMRKYLITAIIDTLIFDALASILIPTLLTFGACWLTYAILSGNTSLQEDPINWITTGAGLLMLCATQEEVDYQVWDMMNNSFRRWYF